MFLCDTKVIDSPDAVELLAVLIEDQLLDGPLSVIMSARLVRLMETLITKELRISLLNDYQLSSYGQLQRLLPLLSLEEELRNALHNGLISDKVGPSLSRSKQAERSICGAAASRPSMPYVQAW